MAITRKNLVRMNVSTVGTGSPVTLTTAVTGFKAFAAGDDGLTFRYVIRDGAHSEVGYGVYTHSGTTFTRNVIESTNADSAISLSGSAQIACAPLAEDILDPESANTFSGKQTFTNFLKLQRALEKVTITADNPASGDNNYDVLTQSIQYFTTANDANWVWNIRGDGSTTLNSLMAIGEALTVVGVVTNTGTAYYMTGLKIDGGSVTPEWLGSAAPSAGTINKRDRYTFTIIKTADATFVVDAVFAGGN